MCAFVAKWQLRAVLVEGTHKKLDRSSSSSSRSAGLPLWCVCSVGGGELQELPRLFSAHSDGLRASSERKSCCNWFLNEGSSAAPRRLRRTVACSAAPSGFLNTTLLFSSEINKWTVKGTLGASSSSSSCAYLEERSASAFRNLCECQGVKSLFVHTAKKSQQSLPQIST